MRIFSKNPKVFLVDFLPFNINGIATPFGVLIKKSSYNKYILEHEIIHYNQWQKGGIIFLLDYIGEFIIKGYDKNKYEIEARRSESNYCKYNYIECQRKGLAKSNLFRKNKRFGKLL